VLSREIYIRTPSHCYGNHQSNVRLWSKLRLIVGLASRVAQSRYLPSATFWGGFARSKRGSAA
jgi:hypothetical protein